MMANQIFYDWMIMTPQAFYHDGMFTWALIWFMSLAFYIFDSRNYISSNREIRGVSAVFMVLSSLVLALMSLFLPWRG
jgi:arginine exporter protein ArgO